MPSSARRIKTQSDVISLHGNGLKSLQHPGIASSTGRLKYRPLAYWASHSWLAVDNLASSHVVCADKAPGCGDKRYLYALVPRDPHTNPDSSLLLTASSRRTPFNAWRRQNRSPRQWLPSCENQNDPKDEGKADVAEPERSKRSTHRHIRTDFSNAQAQTYWILPFLRSRACCKSLAAAAWPCLTV